jgi:branched-chain amino acid transport system ATP-binding protein
MLRRNRRGRASAADVFELDNIDAGYGDTAVLRGVSLRVPDAAVVALVGANGAGKTTLLRVASGLLRPTSGHVYFDGADVTPEAPHERAARGLCHVPEGRGIFRGLTVREHLTLFDRSGDSAAAIERMMTAFPRLGERLGQVAGTMSGGEQQMLALARAYISGAKLVLLDEVSMGLAPNLVDQIFAFLAVLADEGRALLVVEQFVSKALGIADYACLLVKGQLAMVGEPAEFEAAELADAYLGSTEPRRSGVA